MLRLLGAHYGSILTEFANSSCLDLLAVDVLVPSHIIGSRDALFPQSYLGSGSKFSFGALRREMMIQDKWIHRRHHLSIDNCPRHGTISEFRCTWIVKLSIVSISYPKCRWFNERRAHRLSGRKLLMKLHLRTWISTETEHRCETLSLTPYEASEMVVPTTKLLCEEVRGRSATS